MAYERGSGCQSGVILSWRSRGGEDISDVCKCNSVRIPGAGETNTSAETKALS